jgi:hypothetical protein
MAQLIQFTILDCDALTGTRGSMCALMPWYHDLNQSISQNLLSAD